MLYGSDKGFAKPALLNDRQGNLMHTGRYWDPGTKQHTSGKGPGGRAYSALPLDWDGDGDLDLVVGIDNGNLVLRINEGTATKPAYATETTEILAGDTQATVPGGYAMPVAADWDGDGRIDLLSGNKAGTVYWFRNVGDGEIQLAPPKSITRGGDRSDPDPKAPVYRVQIDVADFDGDGDLDLLVGDYARHNDQRHGWIWLYRQTGPQASTTDASAEKQTRSAKD